MKTLYYTYKRAKGSKWATAIVYQIKEERLVSIGPARWQPGATAGTHHEIANAAIKAGALGQHEAYEAREIDEIMK